MKLYTLGTSHGAVEGGRACSANLVEVGGVYYLFDCGAATELRLGEVGINPTDVRAVFISHMHEDHVGGISSIIKRFTAYNPEMKHTAIYLADESAKAALSAWIDTVYPYRWTGERFMTEFSTCFELKAVEEGTFYDDGNLKVRAIPTRHSANGRFPSFAFVFEGEGKRVFYTGDLNACFSDFPTELLDTPLDLMLSELVHFNVSTAYPVVSRMQTKRLVFTHYSKRKLGELASANVTFPFQTDIARDRDVFEI